jgi:bis(5'-nucleosyl)-tetraphosphatase (symmetrical)
MNIYAIGSVNGDIASLLALLNHVKFDKTSDSLWFTGNLINGGQDNTEVLRFVKGLGKQAVYVLGYQELRLLSIAEGVSAPQTGDSFDDVLAAPDRDELIKWLYLRPLLHHQSGFTMVHAGIPPEWSMSQVRTFAIEAESSLSMGNRRTFFENIHGDQPTRWHAKHRGWNRTRFIVNALTRMHYLNAKGRLDFTVQNQVSEDYVPWYQVANRRLYKEKLIFSNHILNVDECEAGLVPIRHLSGDDGMLRAVRLTPTPHGLGFVKH